MHTAADGTVHVSIGFSPCPNDTYIFDALINGKLDTGRYRFDPIVLDVQELNRLALEGRLDVTKISYRAYADCAHEYIISDSGSALGTGVGPLLVSLPGKESQAIETVGIPGEQTTANFLFRLFYPHVEKRVEMLFSNIEEAVIDGQVDAGVIIHENRFTYAAKGLVKLADLGNAWEGATGQPIPLGGIVIKRSMDNKTISDIDQLIRQSVEFANRDPQGTHDFVQLHAQEMDPDVMRKHIELYVNEYSIDLGVKGRTAIRYFFDEAVRKGILNSSLPEPFFVSDLILK